MVMQIKLIVVVVVVELLKDATTYPQLQTANNLVINKEIMYKKAAYIS